MKSTSLFALVFAAAMYAACGGARSGGDGGPVTIDVAAGYPGENVSLQAVADVEYVPLAISDGALLSPDDRVFHLSDRYIMVSVRRTGTICVFDRTGAIVSHFGRPGRGPGEYATFGDAVFEVQTLDFESIRAGSYPPIRSLKYDRATGKTTGVMFTNDDNPSEPWSNYGINTAGLPRNTTARMLSPLKLKDALEKGELSGPLADIAAKIKEDDNPVVMIVKFK